MADCTLRMSVRSEGPGQTEQAVAQTLLANLLCILPTNFHITCTKFLLLYSCSLFLDTSDDRRQVLLYISAHFLQYVSASFLLQILPEYIGANFS